MPCHRQTGDSVLALRRIIPFKILNWLGLVPYFCGATLGKRELYKALSTVGFDVHETGFLMHVPRVIAVQLCRIVDWIASPRLSRAAIFAMCAFERVRGLPTARFSGHYVVALAQRPAE